jgi:hypothetical protein
MDILRTERVEIAKLLEKQLDADVIAMLQDAVAQGYAFADVIAMLGESGYHVAIKPVDPEEDDYESEDVAPVESSLTNWMKNFKNMYMPKIQKKSKFKEGDFVNWDAEGGVLEGRVEYVMTDGMFGLPDSDYSLEASPEDPAVLVRVYDQGEETELLVGFRQESLRDGSMMKAEETFTPPKGVREAAQRAKEWISQGLQGDGFTAVGQARATQLANGDPVSLETVQRMANYFIRHDKDQQAEGFKFGEKNYPRAGRVAWDAWGGDAGKSWANSILARQDVAKEYEPALSTRQQAMYEFYEALVEGLGAFDGGSLSEGAHYMPADSNPFIEKGLACKNCVFYEGGGGCELLDFPVEPEALCKLWVIPQALILEKSAGQKVAVAPNEIEFMISKQMDEKRFTLAPLYVPNMLDAHGEFTDPEELQQAVWKWVQKGDRGIRLQHNKEVVAGEWVEVMSLPYPMTVPMYKADGTVSEITYPSGTAFLGVLWEPWAWELVKSGKLSGYSIGGRSQRIEVDFKE